MIAEDQDERVLGFSHTISDTILKQGMDEQSKSHSIKNIAAKAQAAVS